MIKQKVYALFTLTLFLTSIYGQKSINQFDKDGKRHGLWAKDYHKTNQKRYEGIFLHGKEIDSFKYYSLSSGKSVLSAVKVFNDKDSLADVTFFASNKTIISKGKMNGKSFIGEWIYYHKNSTAKMIVENFNSDGKLEGERHVYYKNGLVAEQASYKEGKLHGESKWFSENNKFLRTSMYKDNQLHGKTVNYNAEEQITSEGDYINDRKKGIWNYYIKGKLSKEIDHTTNTIIKKYK